MKQNTILLFTFLGISVWFFANPAPHHTNMKRSLASQVDIDDEDEEYDFHESINVKKDKDAKPILKKGKSDKKNAPHETPNKKIMDVLEDSEFSKLDTDRLIKLCKFGNKDACHDAGLKLISADPKSIQATQLFARGCSLKNYSDCHQVGELLKNTFGSNKALPYFRAACEQAGLADSCFEAAVITSEKSQTASDLQKTNEYFNIACLEGNAKGCLSLAGFYANNWSKHQYYLTEACRIDSSLDSGQCQQLIN